MNCTQCNTPGARYQFIDGLCHSCTAKLKNEWCLKYTELSELYSKTADELQRYKDLECYGMDTGEIGLKIPYQAVKLVQQMSNEEAAGFKLGDLEL